MEHASVSSWLVETCQEAARGTAVESASHGDRGHLPPTLQTCRGQSLCLPHNHPSPDCLMADRGHYSPPERGEKHTKLKGRSTRSQPKLCLRKPASPQIEGHLSCSLLSSQPALRALLPLTPRGVSGSLEIFQGKK